MQMRVPRFSPASKNDGPPSDSMHLGAAVAGLRKARDAQAKAGATLKPQAGPQTAFLESRADITIYGGGAGGGKTWGLLAKAAKNRAVRGFGAVIFRRTFAQITQQGGIWAQSDEIYPQLGGRPNQTALRWRFPGGGEVQFAHLQHESDKHNYQGAEICLLCFDELTHFSITQFFYLLSRNRSTCGVPCQVLATCNPDADSWVAELLAWWIDQETGFPDPGRSGVIRWLAKVDDVFVWGDTPEEITTKHPEALVKSITFIPASLDDNPILDAKDPGYRANLTLLDRVERERLLGCNWKIRAAAGLYFKRAWLPIVEASPVHATRVRYWDKAGTAGGGAYTAGVLEARTKDGWWVEDVVRGQWSAGEREQTILATAKLDAQRFGSKTAVTYWVEQEPGSGGKESAENTVRMLGAEGFIARSERVTGDKETRAKPFSAQCEAGNVRLVAGDWNEAFIVEAEGFPEARYKDQVDAGSGAFNKLAQDSDVIPTGLLFDFGGQVSGWSEGTRYDV